MSRDPGTYRFVHTPGGSPGFVRCRDVIHEHILVDEYPDGEFLGGSALSTFCDAVAAPPSASTQILGCDLLIQCISLGVTFFSSSGSCPSRRDPACCSGPLSVPPPGGQGGAARLLLGGTLRLVHPRGFLLRLAKILVQCIFGQEGHLPHLIRPDRFRDFILIESVNVAV